jgi:hypothetical protein
VLHSIEVLVSTQDRQRVLPGESGDPDVVLRNRCASGAELVSDLGVVRRRGQLDREHDRVEDEPLQQEGQLASLPGSREAVGPVSDRLGMA